jgi:hypothetical protein
MSSPVRTLLFNLSPRLRRPAGAMKQAQRLLSMFWEAVASRRLSRPRLRS